MHAESRVKSVEYRSSCRKKNRSPSMVQCRCYGVDGRGRRLGMGYAKSCSSSLACASSTRWSSTPAPTVLEPTPTSLVHASTSSGISISSVCTSLGSTRFDVDCLPRDLMGIGSCGSLIALRSSVFDKGAILNICQTAITKLKILFRLTLLRLTSK